MKVSIITVCLNSADTIKFTLNSVVSQDYKNIEHVIVDGGSNDETINILKRYKFKNKKIFFKKKLSLYESINFGIKKAKGDLISILHSDDIFNNDKVISRVSRIVKKSNVEIFFGNVVYFKNDNFEKIVRYYSSKEFKLQTLLQGNMPPHTGSFYKKKVFKNYGLYKKNYKIAGDFEHILRLIYINKNKFKKIDLIITRMKTGGLSSKNFYSFVTINAEILKTLRFYKIKSSIFDILLRVPSKILQYIIFNQNQLNYNFRFKINKLLKNEFYNQLNVINDIKKLNFKKNFILSALNLAFLGSLSQNKIQLDKNLINWPDGIFSGMITSSLTKTPGRQVLKDLQVPKNISQIIVLGNLSEISKLYLKKRFGVKLRHIKLPYGTIKQIIKKINLNIKINDLIFLTLPTPKQEQIALHLKKQNKNFKIICIGGSIGIASGEEKVVPKYLFYLEFLWRLRYETFRRTSRLFITFYQYFYDIFFVRKLQKIKLNIIK